MQHISFDIFDPDVLLISIVIGLNCRGDYFSDFYIILFLVISFAFSVVGSMLIPIILLCIF